MGAVYKKAGNWYIDYYVGHDRKRKKIGRDKKTAELALKDVEVKVARGEYLGIYEEKKVTLLEFSDEFLKLVAPSLAPGTLKEYGSMLSASLLPAFGNRYLSQITNKEIEEYRARRAQSVGKLRINHEVTLLKNMFRRAAMWGRTKNNPCAGVRNLRIPERHPRFLSNEEISLLLDNATTESGGLIAVAIYTGLRASELVHLEWSDIDYQKGTITVQNKVGWTTKSKKNRVVPIAPALLPYLKGHPRHFQSSYVFTNSLGMPLPAKMNWLRRIGRLAGVAGLTPHVLRNTFASHLVMQGVDLVTVKELLGHADIATTMRYSHLTPDHLMSAVTKLAFSRCVDTSHQAVAAN